MADRLLKALDIAELSATPANPSSGYQRIYPKTDGRCYALTSSGVEGAMVTPNSTDSLANKTLLSTCTWNGAVIDNTYLGMGQAAIIAASAGINTTETIIVKSPALAINRLVVGTTIRIVLIGTCTSTAANVSTFAVRIGTAGTVADGVVISGATATAATTGTNVPFRVVIELTVRTVGSGTTGTVHGIVNVFTNGGTSTGIAIIPVQVILPTFTGFNTTAANIISATYKSAAVTTTCTFQDAFIEFIYK